MWVFGYGSLMWNPGFAYETADQALLQGYHRCLCVYSHLYRGTPERPGLVAGLLAGGSCWGRAFKIAEQDREAVTQYLDDREMVYGVYEPRWASVLIGGEQTRAYTYVANHAHPQFAGKLSAAAAAKLIHAGAGVSGSGIDYLKNTVDQMAALGIEDRRLTEVLKAVQRLEKGKKHDG